VERVVRLKADYVAVNRSLGSYYTLCTNSLEFNVTVVIFIHLYLLRNYNTRQRKAAGTELEEKVVLH